MSYCCDVRALPISIRRMPQRDATDTVFHWKGGASATPPSLVQGGDAKYWKDDVPAFFRPPPKEQFRSPRERAKLHFKKGAIARRAP